MNTKRIYIGTSGYSYPFWKNRFYPEKYPSSKLLEYYATQFDCVELNGSFYRFPTVAGLKKTAAQTGDEFKFSVKANKIITHTRRLKDVKEKIQEFMDLVQEGLGSKLACVLYQFPPSYSYSPERLNDVVENLSDFAGNVIEFRNASWWEAEVKAALQATKLNICSVSYPGLPGEDLGCGTIYYKRMHGIPELFKSSYNNDVLKDIAAKLPGSKEAFVFFNNTYYEAGYTNAATLKTLL